MPFSIFQRALRASSDGALCVLAAVMLWVATPLAAQLPSTQLPDGFREVVFGTGLARPTAFEFLPDGRLLICEQSTGRVVLMTSAASTTAATIPEVSTDGAERGLLGITVEPAWPDVPYVYVLSTHGPTRKVRITRLTAQGDLRDPSSLNLTLRSPWVVFDGIPDERPAHQAGQLIFGNDGHLYVATGDDRDGCLGPDLGSLGGKILRLVVSRFHGQQPTRSATVSELAVTNPPWPGDPSALIHISGLRNPWRVSYDRPTGDFWVADVGNFVQEEVTRFTGAGQDGGWPAFEGMRPGPTPLANSCSIPAPVTPTPPAYSYDNLGGASVMTFGGIYRNPSVPSATAFGAAYEGDLFVADHIGLWVRRLVPGPNGSYVPATPEPGQPSAQNWANFVITPTDAKVGPDGAIWWLNWIEGEVLRIERTPQAAQLSVVGGDAQAGLAGQPLAQMLEVRVEDAAGTPLAGVPLRFEVQPGSGWVDLGPQPVLSDASGVARVSATMGLEVASAPIVVAATTPGAPAATFSLDWRGLAISLDPALRQFDLQLRAQGPNLGFVMLFDANPPAVPVTTPYGTLFVEILAGAPSVLTLDGVGLYGAPNPLFRTDAFGGYRLRGILPSSVPGSTQIWRGQAAIFDPAAFPTPAGLLITNPIEIIG